MKKLIFISVIFSLYLFINATDKITSFVLASCGPHPFLPSTPFDYSLPEFPEHFNDSLDLGYRAVIRKQNYDRLNDIDKNKATIGRVLFYDKILSSNENISCASCHKQELSFADGQSFSEGLNSLTKRNSLHLNDLVWDAQALFSWDMGKQSLADMISLPLNDDNEIGINMEELADKMYNTTYYPSLFQIAYQHPVPKEEWIIECLVHFINSMHTFNSRLDQQAKKGFEDFTTQEKLGKKLFGESCSRCHSQGQFYYPTMQSNFNGLALDPNDLGAGEWNPDLKGLFRLPTLKNIALTAPYMHDGRHSTLEDVVKHYSDSIVTLDGQFSWFLPVGGFDFSDKEQAALVAFMETFTDETFATNEKWSDPFVYTSDTEDVVFDPALSISPNPASDVVHLSYENTRRETVTIDLLSGSGQLIKTYQTRENTFTISNFDLTEGLYILKLAIGKKTVTRKLIVK